MTEGLNLSFVVSLRQDGGLRVWSNHPDLRGLILSGPDHANVLECVGPAIKTLLEHQDKWLQPYLKKKDLNEADKRLNEARWE